MFRSVLFTMILFGGILGGGIIGGCGETDGGQTDGSEGEGSSGEGEGEGSTEGEGEGVLPPGGDREPCGADGTCQDGLECLTCEEADITSVPDPDESPGETKTCEGRVCTCPQWFEGTWWAEFEPRAVGYEYDFSSGGTTQQMWMDQEIELQQMGCDIVGPPSSEPVILVTMPQYTTWKVDPQPNGFYYRRPALGGGPNTGSSLLE